MSDVQIYGADAAEGSQQQQNVIVVQFTDEAIEKIIQAYAKHKDREQRQFDVRGYMIVLATLIASITYTAALTPPGGFWSDDANGRSAGTSVWMDKFPLRYRFFFYCNTSSFVCSLCIIVMLGSNWLAEVAKQSIFTLLVLDVIGLIGAFAAGCSTKASSTIYAILSMVVFAATTCLGLLASRRRQRMRMAL